MIKKNVNVDLFRITATIFVIMLHVIGLCGILNSAPNGGANYWTAWFLEIFSYCAVNCFALISGFLMINKNIKLKSIVSLWIQILFYSLLFTVLSFVFWPETRTIKNLVVAILPIVGKQWWYMSSYFALFFFIPFLNKAINNISQQTHKKFLLLVLLGICFIGCIIPMDAFSINYGYSFVWLMIVYCFGSYIKKYDIHKKITALKSILCFFTMIILTFVSKISIGYLTKFIFGQSKYENIFISYTSITILMAAIFLFLFFLNIKIGNFGAKLICFFSPATLGVYLIHTHSLIFEHVFKDSLAFLGPKPLIVMILGIFVATFAIFASCAAIDLLRIQFFKLIRVNKFSDFVSRKIDSLYLKVFEK